MVDVLVGGFSAENVRSALVALASAHGVNGVVAQAASPENNTFSLEELDRLLLQLSASLRALRGAVGGDAGAMGDAGVSAAAAEAPRAVELLRRVTEILVWGEKHDEALFNLFCERKALQDFISFLQQPNRSGVLGTAPVTTSPASVQVQLLQTLSILVQNSRRDTSFYFLLSGGHLNALFKSPPPLNDEEVLSYFVTFLKSLALRLDAETARMCLDVRAGDTGGFPLFERAVHFATHRDSMLRTGMRTALLSLLRLDDEALRARTLEVCCRRLVPRLSRALRTCWMLASAALRRNDEVLLSQATEAEEDLLGFYNDLLQLRIERITEALSGDLLSTALLPMLASPEPPMAYPGQEDAGAEVAASDDWALSIGGGCDFAGALASASGDSSCDQADEMLQRACARFRCAPAELLPRQASGSWAACNATAVVVRAVALAAQALAGHDRILEPLARVLLWPSISCAIVSAIHSPGGEEGADMLARSVFDQTSSADAAENAEEVMAQVLIPNPFRDALLRLLVAGHEAASADAPLVALALLQLQAVLPQRLLDGTGLFSTSASSLSSTCADDQNNIVGRLVLALRCPSELRPEGRRVVAGVLLELLSNTKEDALRLYAVTARLVAQAVREGAARLLEAMAELKCGSGSGIAALLGRFLDEVLRSRDIDLTVDVAAVCCNARFLLEAAPADADKDGCEAALGALRAFLLLLRLFVELRGGSTSAAPAGQLAKPAALGFRDLEDAVAELRDAFSGTLDLGPDSPWASFGAALPPVGTTVESPRAGLPLDALVPCALTRRCGDDVACHPVSTLVLHPSWFLVISGNISGAGAAGSPPAAEARRSEASPPPPTTAVCARAPSWRVTPEILAQNPLLLQLSLARDAGGSGAPAIARAGPGVEELTIRFGDARTCSRVAGCLEAGRQQDLRRLLDRAERFIETASRLVVAADVQISVASKPPTAAATGSAGILGVLGSGPALALACCRTHG